MKNKKGFCFVDIILQLGFIFLFISLGFICFKNYSEQQEVRKAKTEIYEFFTTYAIKAFNEKERFTIELDYVKKEITISVTAVVRVEILKLPKSLKYITIFDKDKKEKFTANVTVNGNITPSFSIYIFGYDDIAKYRISLYGFDLIKYMQINVYRNIDDKTATYNGILNFHNNWTKRKTHWKEE